MGSKSIAITAPAAFLLERVVVGDRRDAATGPRARDGLRALGLAAPLLLLAAWSVALHLGAFASNPGGGVGEGSPALPAGRYFLSQLRVQWLYLRLLAWPDALALDRGFTPSPGLDAASAIAGLGILAALALAVGLWLRAARSTGPAPASRIAAFGILFWFLVLAPTSSVVPVLDLAVEHRVYLASLGPILVLVVAVDAALHRLLATPRAALAGLALAGAALLALGVALSGRARVWATEESLWSDAAARFPRSPRILTNLGLALQTRGDLAGAESAYRQGWAVATAPLDVVQLSRNLGGLLSIVGRFPESLAIVDRGLEVAPEHPDLRMNRAVALVQMGRAEEALADARLALTVAPREPTLLGVYGQILSYQKSWAEALAAFQAATALDPGSPTYFTHQALPLAGLGRTAEACQVLHEAAARYGAERLPKDAQRWKAAFRCPG
jgi:tetratricopeptide (TPR) repeat protein